MQTGHSYEESLSKQKKQKKLDSNSEFPKSNNLAKDWQQFVNEFESQE